MIHAKFINSDKEPWELWLNPDHVAAIAFNALNAPKRALIHLVGGGTHVLAPEQWEVVKPMLLADVPPLPQIIETPKADGPNPLADELTLTQNILAGVREELAKAEARIRMLEGRKAQLAKAREAVKAAQTAYDVMAEEPAYLGEEFDVIEAYHADAEFFFELYDETDAELSAKRFALNGGAVIPAVTEVGDLSEKRFSLNEDAVIPAVAEVGDLSEKRFSLNEDTKPAAQSDEGCELVTSVKRSTFFSKTSGGNRTMWTLCLEDGRKVNVFDHADPLRDHKGLLAEAGYLAFFQTMAEGAIEHWSAYPIRVRVQPSGKFWELTHIFSRPVMAEPDTPSLDGDLTPEQLKVCIEAKELLADPRLRVIDSETTGLLNDDEVVELAGYGASEDAPLFETLIRPQDMSKLHRPGKGGKTAAGIHGIDELMLVAAKPMSDPSIRELMHKHLGGTVLVAFNMPFDTRLLIQSWDQANGSATYPTPAMTKCAQAMMNCFTGKHFTSLDDACQVLGITRGKTHRAGVDALDTLRVLKALAAKVPVPSEVEEKPADPDNIPF